MNDFTFIFWELKRRAPLTIHGGYPCIGYPQADKLVPAFEKVGANLQPIEFCDFASLDFGLKPEKDQKEPFKTIGQKIQSDKVLVEWDGITSHRDYMNIFKWNKEIYVIPHHAGMVGGVSSPSEEGRIRKIITDNSKKVIFQLEWERAFWKELECDKFITINPPTRTGKQFDKMESRKILGITTEYALICWGNYFGKNYEALIPWIAEWKDTSLLFVGSGDEQKITQIGKTCGVSKNIFFSPHGISDVDADLWFSASDLCSYPRDDNQGTSTPTHVIGQRKCMVTRNFPSYIELEKLSGVVTTTYSKDLANLKEITRELLLNEDKRKLFESKSLEYARNNSYENYAIKVGKLMGFSYSRRET